MPDRFQAPGGASVAQLQAHLSRNPDDGPAWLALAQLLCQGPPGPLLYHALEQSIKSQPDHHQTWLLAGQVHERERGLNAALGWLESMARQNPRFAAPRLAQASLLFRSEPDRAVALFDRMGKTFPSDRRAPRMLAGLYRDRADTHLHSGKWRKALEDYREAKKGLGEDAEILNNMGSCHAGLEEMDSARRCFEKALKLDPELIQARLNMGLLRACQLENEAAVIELTRLLDTSTLEPETRRSVRVVRDTLLEHRRLAPALLRALESGEVGVLQSALDQAPPELSVPDPRCVDWMRRIADRIRHHAAGTAAFAYSAPTRALPFVEACLQGRKFGGAAEMASLWHSLKGVLPDDRGQPKLQQLRDIWQCNLDRRENASELLQGRNGEAWLKYWQARLLRHKPLKLPGQYKAIENTVGGQKPVPPEKVSGTFRVLLSEIRPTVPDGLAAGVLMYIAIIGIHGFVDGNGRLARFAMGWELESSGEDPIPLPLDLRGEMRMALNDAQNDGRVGAVFSVLQKARLDVDALLGRPEFNLSTRLAQPGD